MINNFLSKKICGTIVEATPIETVTTGGGHQVLKAQLWIRDESNPEGINEIALTVTNPNLEFVGCVGYRVECTYHTRSFTFLDRKTGSTRFGNEHCATAIKPIARC